MGEETGKKCQIIITRESWLLHNRLVDGARLVQFRNMEYRFSMR